MATVNVQVTFSASQGGAGKVCYQVIHRRQVRQIVTDMYLTPEEWDKGKGWFVAGDEGKTLKRWRVEGEVALLRRIVREFEQEGEAYSAADVVERFRGKVEQSQVLRFMREQVEGLKRANRWGTAQNYEKALRSFSAFLEGKDLTFHVVTESLIGEYNAHLFRRGMVRNSVSFHMRILRAVYNKAMRQRLVEQVNPFGAVYTGIDRTRKRAVAEDVVKRLQCLKLPEGSALALARDLFVFSYCARGIAFVDVAYLRKEDIREGTICYSRRKTGQALAVKIEPVMRRIIDRHSTPGGVYVFPLLSSTDVGEAYRQYRLALNAYNRALAQLSPLLPDGCKLTSYVARHSWATAARNHHVPLSVISAGMGHASERTTQIYLAEIENSVIDTANQEIIRALNERVP